MDDCDRRTCREDVSNKDKLCMVKAAGEFSIYKLASRISLSSYPDAEFPHLESLLSYAVFVDAGLPHLLNPVLSLRTGT